MKMEDNPAASPTDFDPFLAIHHIDPYPYAIWHALTCFHLTCIITPLSPPTFVMGTLFAF